MRTPIRGGVVLTLDRDGHLLEGEDVVEDNTLIRVGGRVAEQDCPFDRIIDAGGIS